MELLSKRGNQEGCRGEFTVDIGKNYRGVDLCEAIDSKTAVGEVERRLSQTVETIPDSTKTGSTRTRGQVAPPPSTGTTTCPTDQRYGNQMTRQWSEQRSEEPPLRDQSDRFASAILPYVTIFWFIRKMPLATVSV